MNTKVLATLGVLAIAGAGVAYVLTRGGSESESAAAPKGAGGLALPALATHAGDVGQITVKRAPMEFTIRKDGETWKVTEKAGYPAKLEAVRNALVGLSQLKFEEPKTTRPDQYAKLGVDDPIAPPGDAADKAVPQSVLVTLKDGAGKELGSIILGNPKYGGQGVLGSNTAQGVYIRKPGDSQSWLASGTVELPHEPNGWLETKFADIKKERVKSVVVTQNAAAGGTVVAVERERQADPFVVKDIPAGRELKDPGVGETIAATLTALSFQDVAGATGTDPAGVDVKPGPTIVLRTFDGLVVTATSTTKDAKVWWRLTASADEGIVAGLPTAASVNATPADPAKAGDPAPSPPVSTQEAIRKEVAELNGQWAAFAFSPIDWKVRSVNTTMMDLLKEPAAPAGAAPGQPLPLPGK